MSCFNKKWFNLLLKKLSKEQHNVMYFVGRIGIRKSRRLSSPLRLLTNSSEGPPGYRGLREMGHRNRSPFGTRQFDHWYGDCPTEIGVRLITSRLRRWPNPHRRFHKQSLIDLDLWNQSDQKPLSRPGSRARKIIIARVHHHDDNVSVIVKVLINL